MKKLSVAVALALVTTASGGALAQGAPPDPAPPAGDPPAGDPPPAAPEAPPPAETPPAAEQPAPPAEEKPGEGLAQDQAGMGTEKEGEQVTTAADLDAQEGPTKKPIVDRSESGEKDVYGHGMQAGLRVGFAYGYRMIFRYDESPFCAKPDPATRAKDEQKFCGHAGQPAVEVALSFGATDAIEPFLWGRFGIGDGEPETNTKPVRMLGAGLRIYTMADSRFKILVEPAVGYEFEGGAGNKDFIKPPGLAEGSDAFEAEYKKDVVFRLHAGPQYDPAKAVGFFLSAGMTVGVLRAIHSSLEGILGVQVRVP